MVAQLVLLVTALGVAVASVAFGLLALAIVGGMVRETLREVRR